MLGDFDVQPMLPVGDLEAAKAFYEGKLGLKSADEMPDTVVVYRSGKGTLCVYRSEYAGTNQGTAALWEVDDVEGMVEDLKGRGVTFVHYDDLPGLTRKGDVHSAGPMRVAWFKDPAGNILSLQNRPAKP